MKKAFADHEGSVKLQDGIGRAADAERDQG
jgi:hypothetical protein